MANHKNEELHDFASRKRMEWAETPKCYSAENVAIAEKKISLDHQYLDMRANGATIDEATEAVFPNASESPDVATIDHFDGLDEAEKIYR